MNKRVLVAVLVAVIIVSVAAYQYWASLPKGPLTIRYGYLPFVDATPLFVATEKGFFSDENLNMSLSKFFAGVQCIEAAVAGSIDMGHSALYSTLVAYDGGVDLKIATDGGHNEWEHPPDVLAVLKDSPIKSIEDLKGKSIATQVLVGPHSLAQEALFRRHGFGPEDVNMVVIPFPNIPEALLAGTVDAANLWGANYVIAMETGKVRVLSYYYTEVFPNRKWQMCTTFIMRSFLDKHKDAVDAFIRAWTRAVDWVNENPQETREIIAKWTGLDPEMAKKIDLKFWSRELDAGMVKDIADLMLEYGHIEKKITVEDIIYKG